MKGKEKGQMKRNKITSPPPKGNKHEQHHFSLTFFVLYRAIGEHEHKSQQFLYIHYIGGAHISKLVVKMALCSANYSGPYLDRIS